MLSILLLYAISASTFVIGKLLLTYSSPIFLTGLRTVVAGLAYLIYLKATSQFDSIKKYLFSCLQIALFSFYLSNIFKFWALKHLTSKTAATISTFEPFFAVLFSYYLCSEKMTLKKWLGLLLCISGSLVFTLENPFRIANVYNVSTFGLAEAILLLAIAFSSYGAIFMRQLIRTSNCSVALVNGISMLSAGILAITTSVTLEDPVHSITSFNQVIPFFLLLGTMVIISNIVAYSLYGNLLKKYSAVLISSASLLRPFFVAVYSGAITYNLLLSSCIILLGLFLLYREEVVFEAMAPQAKH
jgi:drug/metabolite transporter (DMT)-like permease